MVCFSLVLLLNAVAGNSADAREETGSCRIEYAQRSRLW